MSQTPPGDESTTMRREKGATPQLSCTNCSARKVRCDKGNPCSRCNENGIPCTPVYRQRLPRGRHVRPSKSSDGLHQSASQNRARGGSSSTNLSKRPVQRPNITDSIYASNPASHRRAPDEQTYGDSDDDSPYVNDHGAAFRTSIWQVFIERVSPVIRVFHIPSLRDFFLDDKPYTGYGPLDQAHELVFPVVVHCSLAALTDQQCRNLLGQERASWLRRYRLACEAALTRLNHYATDDLTLLQSYVALIVSLRSYDRSRKPWTMAAVAMRIATDLKINSDDHFTSETFFQQQMRRRLWYTMCLMDMHLALERYSEPLIRFDSIHPRLPISINDADFGPHLALHTEPRDELTDLSLILLLFHAQSIGKVLAFRKSATPETRAQLLGQFEAHVRRLVRQCEAHTSTYAWHTLNGSLGALATMQLHMQQPKQEIKERDPSDDNHTSLLLAAKCLNNDKTMRTDPRGENFRWWRVFQWHPLAVALTKVCVCNNVDLLRALWPLIEENYEQARRILATNNPPLWEPLERLMDIAQPHLNALLADAAPDAAPDASEASGSSFSAPSYHDPSLLHSDMAHAPAILPAHHTNDPYPFDVPPDPQAVAQQYVDSLPMFIPATFDMWQDMFDDFSLQASDDLIAQLLADGSGNGY